jgi:amino acid permease
MNFTWPIYALSGVAGYFAFGKDSKYIVIFNLPNEIYYVILKFMFALNLCMTIAIKLFPILTIL